MKNSLVKLKCELWKPRWEDESLRKLSNEDKEWLQRPFTLEEQEVVIKTSKGDEAPWIR